MNYFIYILYSSKVDKYYIGYTSNLNERLLRHNTKHSGFNGMANDWEIVYFEKFETKSEAMQREKEIKKKKSRRYLEYLISKN